MKRAWGKVWGRGMSMIRDLGARTGIGLGQGAGLTLFVVIGKWVCSPIYRCSGKNSWENKTYFVEIGGL